MEASARVQDDKQRRRCEVEGCTSLARSRGRCKAHGGGGRCQFEGCTRAAQSGGRCVAHGGGMRCSFANCHSGAQSRGLCKRHGGGARCGAEGCSKSAQGNGLCREHGGGYKCKFPGGCTNWAQTGGFCLRHCPEQASAVSPRSSAAAAECVSFTTRKTPCRVEGCVHGAERPGLCRMHNVKPRCNFQGGCRNIAHSNGVCLAHLNSVLAPSYDPQIPTDNTGVSSPPAANESAVLSNTAPSSKSILQITSHQQEFQARQYCDDILAARSADLFALLGGDATFDSVDNASDAQWMQLPIQTTARAQQRVAEQFCNETLAARAIQFIRSTPALARVTTSSRKLCSDQVKECNIRGCRNLTNRRPLCAAHEVWATGNALL
ncbi:unnamed protein product [Phytophthora lilii]|uniref:Unnamed protein product n=1 Tax=Phytophthora lilii TaxID=2077276 RepID=A0A9W6TLY6_9STRA|nr:unnamed protein product [Phytophthora lilii]